MIDSFSSVPPEAGGIIGKRDNIICAYLHDTKTQCIDRATYIPDIEWMNCMIQEWAYSGIEFAGIVHSHPKECSTLSGPDRAYICEIMNAMPTHITELYFPIILPGEGMYAYKAVIQPCGVTIKADIITFIENTNDMTR